MPETVSRILAPGLQGNVCRAENIKCKRTFEIYDRRFADFILANAKEAPEVAAECLDHLRRYIEMLFTQTGTKKENPQCQPHSKAS
jgi:hypothetical protein